MAKIYAVAVGRKTGLFTDWDEAKGYVDGFAGAKYKSFFSSEDAQKYLDVGGVIEKPKVSIARIKDISKTCLVYADATGVPTNNSFRVCGVIETAKGLVHTRAWSWQEDYELGSDLNMQCYAYIHTLSRAYREGYRDFIVIFKNDCLKGWAEGWKAKSVCGKFYKEALSMLRSRYGCTFSFQKFVGAEPSHTKLQHEVKLMLQSNDESEDYIKFGFKSEM